MVSILDIIGPVMVGPSSSHTAGACRLGLLARCLVGGTPERATIELHGSFARTGEGHGTDKAVILGLMGETPEDVDVAAVDAMVAKVRQSKTLVLAGGRAVPFLADDLMFHRESLPFHPNGMRFTALDEDRGPVRSRVYYSVGGGFVVDEAVAEAQSPVVEDRRTLAHPFHTAAELLEACRANRLRISEVMLANEQAWRPARAAEGRAAGRSGSRRAGSSRGASRRAGPTPRRSGAAAWRARSNGTRRR